MKTSIGELAIFGGRPEFSETLLVGRPNIGDRTRLLERFADILDRRRLTNDGPCVGELESRIAEFVGVRHCVAVCNATIGLELAIRGLGLKGQVIVPSFTFVATAHALQWQGITPVFCDIDPTTHNIDPACAERLITPMTTGIIGVHVWGRPCNTSALQTLSERHAITLMFDAAHAFACSAGDRMIGGFGRAEVFSFHATKFLNAFEGGAVVTNDDDLAQSLRYMRNFGFADFDDVRTLGVNGKMTEVSAAMGLTSLEHRDEFIATNRSNYHRYQQGLAGIPGLTLAAYDDREQCNYQYVVVELDGGDGFVGRDLAQRILWAEHVIARRYFYPGCHRMEPYRTLYPETEHLGSTEMLAGRVLQLPTGTSVSHQDIDRICGVLRLISTHAEDVKRRIGVDTSLSSPGETADMS